MEKFRLSLCWSGFVEFCRYGYHQKYHRAWVLGHSRAFGWPFCLLHMSHVETPLDAYWAVFDPKGAPMASSKYNQCDEAEKRAGRTAERHAAFERVHDVAALQQGCLG
ncbi:hypothetical protein P3T25_006129 [Paraburkholderia sp. GAS32]